MSGYPPLVTAGNIGNEQVKDMVFPFEQMAARGEPMPEGLDLPDQLAYQFLAGLYARIRNGNLSWEQAIIEKGQMTHQYDLTKRKMDHWSKMSDYYANRTKAVEAAQNAYRKNRTLENADRLSAALDGRL